MEIWNKQTVNKITCNCSVVEDELAFFCDACGVGLRLRFLAGCPHCGDNVLEFVVTGDVALFDDLELPFSVLRANGGDLLSLISI